MTISGYSNAIVDTMLGWLKGFANWVLRLFNLAGSVSISPLAWLAHNWLKLLILFMIVGVAADIIVWLVRWRPHWVWFRKERVIVNDDKFFMDEDARENLDWENDLDRNWQERDYIVASTVVKRKEPPSGDGANAGRKSGRSAKASTIVKRRSDAERQTSVRRGERRTATGGTGRGRSSEEKARRIRAERESDLFGMDGSQPDVTDFYEDEVFNVSNLPSAGETSIGDREQ